MRDKAGGEFPRVSCPSRMPAITISLPQNHYTPSPSGGCHTEEGRARKPIWSLAEPDQLWYGDDGVDGLLQGALEGVEEHRVRLHLSQIHTALHRQRTPRPSVEVCVRDTAVRVPGRKEGFAGTGELRTRMCSKNKTLTRNIKVFSESSSVSNECPDGIFRRILQPTRGSQLTALFVLGSRVTGS